MSFDYTKKIEILVPQYNECENVVKGLLDSIELQQGVNKNEIGVVIVNDCSDIKLSEQFLNGYSYDIKYVVNSKHKGVSYARQTALEMSNAEYVMFCDADDMFINSLAFSKIFTYIEGGFDALVFAFYEQVGKETFMIHNEDDCTFVHGKIYNKKFLEENEIKWNIGLTKHEDLYFNCWALAVADNVIRDKEPIYLWKYNADSVTRSCSDFILDSYNEMIDSYNCLINQFLLLGETRNAAINSYLLVCRCKNEIKKSIWRNAGDKLADFKERIRRFRRKRIKLINTLPIEEKIKLDNILKAECLYNE